MSKRTSNMPFIQVNTSFRSVIENDDLLQKDISKMVADLTGKPENYVMTMIQKDAKMTFAGSDEPCCFIKIKSIGSLTPRTMSESLCQLIASKTNINMNRIYIEFIDIKASNWGFNGSTFG
tara:strand:+ start:1246 stop:1608 length:363 start_codon:yes stop_codon:yes gene_type:complete